MKLHILAALFAFSLSVLAIPQFDLEGESPNTCNEAENAHPKHNTTAACYTLLNRVKTSNATKEYRDRIYDGGNLPADGTFAESGCVVTFQVVHKPSFDTFTFANWTTLVEVLALGCEDLNQGGYGPLGQDNDFVLSVANVDEPASTQSAASSASSATPSVWSRLTP
ncbi:uncharacterized protein KY384_008634 [Bacidia gigantensis]|uniref:uncharacterized protein n=1 Tax=Bacidia gigantensis TaxID=2732470 RepID=UPI001D03BBAF|nr:uncharacterized protein KY384_008634 [Bacidia gigantensis]KAG8527204.1 hypothetical protein KY384_008634 [Bacidia gigantensis]